ncbi:regulatory protein RecX [Bacterioplanes sanyensis]|uniref:regulatory protein RecX n=1 Tax=Bacterioplanes sanyensis TaxID=1249553 RepID=UPI0016738C05|nr:regulatory protein RecX [Bacterioplanes sanyensis]GGY58666.1 regulatory protein RecX [Bacterioplanes sanyensis]
MRKQNSDLDDIASLHGAAVELLARRDHSRQELERKLQPRTTQSELLQQVLDQLAERGWQSDQRFAEMFVRSRCSRGHGPMRVRQDMRQKGLSDHLITQVLSDSDCDWFELAVEVASKKYASLQRDPRWREKLYRFLSYRGFLADQVQHALEQVTLTDAD